MDCSDQVAHPRTLWERINAVREQAEDDYLLQLRSQPPAQTRRRGFMETVLVVDDENSVLRTDEAQAVKSELAGFEAGDSPSMPIKIESDTEPTDDEVFPNATKVDYQHDKRGPLSYSLQDFDPLPDGLFDQGKPVNQTKGSSGDDVSTETSPLGEISQPPSLPASVPPAARFASAETNQEHRVLSASNRVTPIGPIRDRCRRREWRRDRGHNQNWANMTYDSYRPDQHRATTAGRPPPDSSYAGRSHAHRRLTGGPDYRPMGGFERLADVRSACPWDLAGASCPWGSGCPSMPICRDYQSDYAVRTRSGAGGTEYLNCGVAACRRLHVRRTCRELLEQGHARHTGGTKSKRYRCRRGAHDEAGERLRSWRDREFHVSR